MSEFIKIKHRPPLRCYIRRAIKGVSPSLLFATCSLGQRPIGDRCKNCQANVLRRTNETIIEGFKKGVQAGMRARVTIIDELHTISDQVQKEAE